MNDPQPEFTDGPRVPLMVEGLIDVATLRQLCADLHEHARLQLVREKAAANRNCADDAVDLNAAIDRLVAGATPAVQVRYHFDGHDWADTILAAAGGFRVVRCRYDDSAAS